MKVVISIALGGPVDLLRFREYLKNKYPLSELITMERFSGLRVAIAEGKTESSGVRFDIDQVTVRSVVSNNEMRGIPWH